MADKKRKIKGTVLAYILVIMSVVTIVLVSMLSYISNQLIFSINRVEKEKAFQIAEAGIYYYRWYLAHNTSGKTAQELESFWQTGGVLGFSSGEIDYEGIGKYVLEITPPDSGSTIVNVESTGWTDKEPNIKRKVKVRFRRPSWSEYIFLSNSFMNFGDEAEVYGKVHSNAGIRFDGIAHNTVSALPASFDDPSHGGGFLDFGVHTHQVTADPSAPSYPWPDGTVPSHPDVFEGGREFPVPEVSFSGVTSDLANMKTASQTGSNKYFNNVGVGRMIYLKSDGTFDTCAVESFQNTSNYRVKRYLRNSGSGTCSTCSGDCLSNYQIPNNGIIFVENNILFKGVANDIKVSVVAANLSGGTPADIFIGIDDNDIRYNAYDCNNKIGLVAQRNVTVLGDCPNDFTVDAALLAQTGKVGINNASFSNKNSLTFNGAIVSYLQPYFNTGVSGFAVRFYNFDNNLLYCPPPYFPTGTEYSIDLWEEL